MRRSQWVDTGRRGRLLDDVRMQEHQARRQELGEMARRLTQLAQQRHDDVGQLTPEELYSLEWAINDFRRRRLDVLAGPLVALKQRLR